jgi:DNA transformation protein
LKRDPHRFDDLFHDFGRISLRRMFGGEGIYAGEQIIGLVIDDQIYLKTTDRNRADFLAEGCEPFSYMRGKKRMATSYYAVPDRLLDNAEEFAGWVRKAHDAARVPKPPKKRR